MKNIIIGSLLIIFSAILFDCSKEKVVKSEDWEISLISSRIGTDQGCMMNKMISGAGALNEYECRATILTIKPKWLTPDGAELDLMKTKLIIDNDENFDSPYKIVTLTSEATNEKEYELYFKQTRSNFNLEFPGLPIMNVKIDKKNIKPLR